MKVYVLTHIDCTPSVHLSFKEAALQAVSFAFENDEIDEDENVGWGLIIGDDPERGFDHFRGASVKQSMYYIEESEIDLSSIISKIERSRDWANRECMKHQSNPTYFGDTDRISTDVHYGMVEAFDEVIDMLEKLNK